MKLSKTAEYLNGLWVISPEVYQDERGFFTELYRADQFKEMGLDLPFVQENYSGSVKNVLRGLHFQWEPPMGKLMRVIAGEAFLVAVDIRLGSPTLGQWYGQVVNAKEKTQIWAPAGFARGFCVLSDFAEIQYLTTGVYNGTAESGIRWDDSAIGIDWPVKDPILSEKDKKAAPLSEWLKREDSKNFIY